MSFILFFLFILIFILIIASSVVISVIRGILSFLGLTKKSTDRGGPGSSYRTAGGRNAQGGAFYGNRGSSREDTRGARSDASGWHYSPEAEYKRRKRKKIIDANEGEYVDFEEVRD